MYSLARALGMRASCTARPHQSISLATPDSPATILRAGYPAPMADFLPNGAPSDEGNLDGTSDRCYANAAVDSGSDSPMSKIPPIAKTKQSFWTTIRIGWGSGICVCFVRRAL